MCKSASYAIAESSDNYPELYDKPNNSNMVEKVYQFGCVSSFLTGRCENGHSFIKSLFCGREWCRDCGQDNSEIHKRRIARWFGKVMQMKKCGYLVITVPEQLREEMHSKKELTLFRTFVKRKLQRMGYTRGLIRYHFAGECNSCKGKGCYECFNTGAGKEFKPHLNILIEQGYLKDEIFYTWINEIKAAVLAYFYRRFKPGVLLIGNAWFNYAKTKSHRAHKLKYITRSTFRHYDKNFAEMIKGFRITSSWGKWGKCEQKKTSDLVSLENNLCPCCGAPVKWYDLMNAKKVYHIEGKENMDGGYYMLPVLEAG